MHREQSGETFIEAVPPQRMGRNESLEWIDALVDWEPLAAIVAVILDAPRGRPAYRPLLMVKALLLQQWYEASDEDLEQALWDRVSFRRFVGLGLDEDAPDRSRSAAFGAHCWMPPWSRRRCGLRPRPAV